MCKVVSKGQRSAAQPWVQHILQLRDVLSDLGHIRNIPMQDHSRCARVTVFYLISVHERVCFLSDVRFALPS